MRKTGRGLNQFCIDHLLCMKDYGFLHSEIAVYLKGPVMLMMPVPQEEHILWKRYFKDMPKADLDRCYMNGMRLPRVQCYTCEDWVMWPGSLEFWLWLQAICHRYPYHQLLRFWHDIVKTRFQWYQTHVSHLPILYPWMAVTSFALKAMPMSVFLGFGLCLKEVWYVMQAFMLHAHKVLWVIDTQEVLDLLANHVDPRITLQWL